MNGKQLIVMWAAIAVIVIMLVFPPWITERPGQLFGGWISYGRAYAFIVHPPSPSAEIWVNGHEDPISETQPASVTLEQRTIATCIKWTIDTPRLTVQVAIIAIIGAGAILTLQRKG